MNKACYFARVDKSAFVTINFYKQDIQILIDLGYSVTTATKWRDIDWSCDIIFIHWWTWAFVPVFIAKILQKKTLIVGAFNFNCPNADIDYFKRPWYEKFLIRYSVKNSNINIFVSKKEMEQVVNYWGLNNCLYSPLSIQTSLYYPIKELKRKDNIIFSISWLNLKNMKRKCVFEMLDAFKILIDRGYEIFYYIAGRNGNGYESIKQYIAHNGLEKNVLLLGEIDEMQKVKLMRECTIFFQVTKYEAFGLAIAEAMACGAPVITSDVGEVSNVVGDSAIICDGYFPNEIADAVELLLNDKEKRKQLSNLAVKQINNNFQYTRRLNDIKKFLEFL
jgi:glycosyltransferase involved in cell wall biosynthesis